VGVSSRVAGNRTQQKTKCATFSKLKAAQSVVPKVSRSFLQDGSASMYTLKLPDLYPDD
jgi:hypothetical protein